MSRELPVFACACAAGDSSAGACALTRSGIAARASMTGKGMKMYLEICILKSICTGRKMLYNDLATTN
jgi:hypothetical protein